MKRKAMKSAVDWSVISRSLDSIVGALDDMTMPTLRDRFAMAALQGMLAHHGHLLEAWDANAVMRDAYRYADAALKARTPAPQARRRAS